MIAEEMPGVDASVARLRAASAELAATLIELDAHPGRVLFDPSRCTGTTAARATVALDRLAWLWERYLALFDLLTRVDATASRRANRRREHIFALLRAAGGTLRGDPPHPEPGDHVPTLTSGQPAADELGLAAVATTMARVRADLDAVVAAHREQVAVLGGAEEQLARLTAATTRIGSAPPAELTAAAAALAPLTAVRASDPLGLPAQAAAQARAALDRAAVTVNQLVSAYDALDEGLRNADALLDLILAIAAEGEGAARQTAVRIRVAAEELSCLPTGWLDDPDRGLRPWLHRLHGLATAPRRLAAVHGLAAWTTTAEQTLAQARHIAEGNAAPLRRRDELRGLLRALRQKAAATGLAEDPELEQLYAGAHDLLYTAPTDLTVARHKVTAYAGALNRDPHHAGHQDQERGHT